MQQNSILDDLGEEVTGIISPVTVCMSIIVFLVRLLNPEGNSNTSTVYLASMVYEEKSTDSTSEKIEGAFLNALVFVLIIGCMTFMLFFLFKYKCYRFIKGYMCLAVFNMFFFLTGVLLLKVLQSFNIHLDVISFLAGLFNFSVVGVLSLMIIPAPLLLKQLYLIWVGVVTAYLFTFVPEWTSWVILLMMALYDIVAVLAPGGPLKALVELAVERNLDLPALVYESRPAGGRAPTPGFRSRRRGNTITNDNGYVSNGANSQGYDGDNYGDSVLPPEPVTELLGLLASSDPSNMSNSNTDSLRRGILEAMSASAMGRAEMELTDMSSSLGSNSGHSLSLDSHMMALDSRRNVHHSAYAAKAATKGDRSDEEGDEKGNGEEGEREEREEEEGDEEMEGEEEGDEDFDGRNHRHVSSNDFISGKRKTRSKEAIDEEEDASTAAPLFNAFTAPDHSTSGSRNVKGHSMRPIGEATENLPTRGDVNDLGEVVLGMESVNQNPRVLMGRNDHGDSGVVVFSSEHDGNGNGLLFDDDGDESNGIKLGLGDFIFYSMMVGRAAMYDYMTVFACYLCIVAGLGLTLMALALKRQALPALPFSIALGAIGYFLTRLLIEPGAVQFVSRLVFF